MAEKFEASVDFAEQWLGYKSLAIPTQDVIMLPSIKQSIPSSKIRMCDLGCGDGELAAKLETPDFLNSIGLDINETLLRIARQRNLLNFQFSCCDLSRDVFPIESGGVDFIVSSNLLMHIDDASLTHTLGEVRRVLQVKGKGCFYVTDLQWATRNYALAAQSDGSFQSVRNVWQLRAVEFYRTEWYYIEAFNRCGLDVVAVEHLTIPHDDRLDARYLTMTGSSLFTKYEVK